MTTPTPPYKAELDLALRNVHRASLLTKSVLRDLKNNVSAETKADDSPVTIADFAAQALLISALHAVYPSDRFIGEESADALRQNEHLAERVWQLVLRAKEGPHAHGDENGDLQGSNEGNMEDEHASMLAFPTSKEHMFDLIDAGGKSEVTGQGRVWVMDPIDGTATFMQGQQYAVALCLLVDGVQQVGVIACPNLALDVNDGPLQRIRIHEDTVDQNGYGVVLSAVKDQGTYVRSMTELALGQPKQIDLTSLAAKSLHDLDFLEATIGKTSLSQPEHKAVATSLGASWPGTILWSQQMKYAALALGAADVFVRIPKTKDRFTYIWDHAGGHILFQEAGGMIRDFDGKPIDFSNGRKIKGEVHYGMIASMPDVFPHLDRAVKDILGNRNI